MEIDHLGDIVRNISAEGTRNHDGFLCRDDSDLNKMLLNIRDEYRDLKPFRSTRFMYHDAPHPTRERPGNFLKTTHLRGALSIDNHAFLRAIDSQEHVDILERELKKRYVTYGKIVKNDVEKLKRYTDLTSGG
jgi:hypothetical protein